MKRFLKLMLFVSSALLITATSFAANITIGEKLPLIQIDRLGVCLLKGDNATFEPWNSSSFQGRLQIVEYVAARTGIDRIHKSFYGTLRAANLPKDTFTITKLVNANDALWGTSGLIAGEIKKDKRSTPENQLVVDAQGTGQKQWDLIKKSAALIILDPSGQVLFFKEGGLTEAEIESTIQLIKRHL